MLRARARTHTHTHAHTHARTHALAHASDCAFAASMEADRFAFNNPTFLIVYAAGNSGPGNQLPTALLAYPSCPADPAECMQKSVIVTVTVTVTATASRQLQRRQPGNGQKRPDRWSIQQRPNLRGGVRSLGRVFFARPNPSGHAIRS
jgi:hypothetical protein